MNATPAKKGDGQALSPAPSVFDAVNASRGARGLEPVADAVAAPVEEPESVEESQTVEQVEQPPVERPVEAPAAPAPVPPVASAGRPASSGAPTAVDDLGHYVTKVMVDARAAAAEFLASVDGDAARRAATISSQAAIEAASVLAAARADADKIRADARLEADRLVAERLRVAVDLTDRLYEQAGQILAGADRPDLARQQLARFITELTQTTETAAAATTGPPRSTTDTTEG